jgi:hypothetical protein
MKKMILRIIASLVLSVCIHSVQGQALSVADLNTSLGAVGEESSANGRALFVEFNVSDISAVSKVRVLLGTSRNTDDILMKTLEIIKVDDRYFSKMDGLVIPINGNEIKLFIPVDSFVLQKTKFTTVFTEGKDGSISNKLVKENKI